MPDSFLYFITAGAWLGLTGLAWRATRPALATGHAPRNEIRIESVLVPFALVLHAMLLYRGIVVAEGLNLGLANAVSLLVWLTALIYWVAGLAYPGLAGMQSLMAPIGLGAVLVQLTLPSRHVVTYTAEPLFTMHFAIAILAYALVIVATVHALVMLALEKWLHRGALAPRESTSAGDDEIKSKIQRGLDIIEGNPLPDRVYSGLPLLHYKGPEKCKKVIPIRDATGKVIGGNVNIHQVWYDIHIESDTAFLDTTEVAEVPWTITYTVDVLNRGHDDFSPFVMYYDDPKLSPPGMPPLPHVGMDQSYFNMDDGTRTIFKIKMAPGKYYSLTYTWGWRNHPPRVQVSENACKRVKDANGNNKTLVQWEVDVFGENPSANEATKLKAIAKIGDLAPEKRMWSALRIARQAAGAKDYGTVRTKLNEALEAYRDWTNRTQLPRGVPVDRNADVTLLYVNNTTYAEIIGGGWVDFPKWNLRGTTLKITVLNGDYFEHGYQNIDFGGARGWENQFQSSVKLGGSGCWFTFGRAHWWMNIPGMIVVPPASPYNELGMQKVNITYNYEPSRRLRFYQFDPVHHDVAVFSVH